MLIRYSWSFAAIFSLALFALACSCGDDDDDSVDDDADDDDNSADDDTDDDADDDSDDDLDDDTHGGDEECVFWPAGGGIHHTSPDVAMNAAGRFVIGWVRQGSILTDDDEKAAPDDAVMARFYDENGIAAGEAVEVFAMQGVEWAFPRVVAGDDVVLIAWTHTGTDGKKQGVYARLYEWCGVPLGEPFAVAESVGDWTALSSIAMKTDGNFLVHYQVGSFGEETAWVRRYDATGTPVGAAFEVDESGILGIDADGDFVLAWTEGSSTDFDAYARRYQPDGTPYAEKFRVNQATELGQVVTGLAVAPDGHFVVAWHFIEQYNAQVDAFARVFEADGLPRTDEFRMNEDVPGEQPRPDVAMAANGRFVAVWPDRDPGEYAFGAKGRLYDENATPLGEELAIFNVRDVTDLGNNSRVAMANDGIFVAVTDRYDDADEFVNVAARRFDADGNPLCVTP
ncbi:hypothetical protein K8I61_01965 [bacterium]|nr:hypothetical protein [bacterium]